MMYRETLSRDAGHAGPGIGPGRDVSADEGAASGPLRIQVTQMCLARIPIGGFKVEISDY